MEALNIGLLSKLKYLRYLKFPFFASRLFDMKYGLAIGFFIFMLPDMIGMYYFLNYYGIPWFLSIPGTIGASFGGPVLELLNTANQIQGAKGVEIILLGIGAYWSIHKVFYGVALIKKFNTVFGSQDNPQIFLVLIGGGAFLLSLTVALAIDMYALPANAKRVPGIIYTLTNLDSTILPLADVARDHFMQEAINQSINKSITNSTIG